MIDLYILFIRILLIFRGKNVEELKKNLKKIITKTQELNLFLKHGVKHIQSYCHNLRLEVQHTTEAIVKQINELKFSLIDKINMYEKKSIILFEINDIDKSLVTEHFNNKFETIESFHNEWLKYLKKPKIAEERVILGNDLAKKNLKTIIEINMNEIILNRNVLKFVKSDERLFGENLLGGLQFQVDYSDFKKIEFKKLILGNESNEEMNMQNSYIDYLGDYLYFSAYEDKGQFLKFAVLNEIAVVDTFTHDASLTVFNHFITNQTKHLVLIDYGYGNLFRIFNKNLKIIHEICLKDLELKGANHKHIFMTSLDLENKPLHVYDWNFELVKSFGQRDRLLESFYFPTSDEKVFKF